MKFLIAGGGTGGHVFPGIAIAQALKRKCSEPEILFVGTQSGFEAKAVPEYGFALENINVSGLKSKSPVEIIKALFRLPWAVVQSIQILRRFKPDMVIGVGGYASGPVLLAAWLLRYPRVICEQNSVPGLTNRILGKLFVEHIWGAFSSASAYFPKGRYLTFGNPLREEFMHRPLPRNSKNSMMILGGSRGARPLNEMLPDALGLIQDIIRDYPIIHQAGRKDVERVKRRYESQGLQVQVSSFIDDMPKAYESAKLVIARAGATTCAELTAMGVPSILIPFPQAADDHQTKNAEELVKAGAAVMVAQADCSVENLAGLIRHVLLDLKSLENMANKARQIGKVNAADIVAQKVVELC
ncbi:MAG: undecaprenyldiphospho-muramoylpentapeptide beta-N-acetylglucosaminyltransferase [Deltaproteobacteria bacterium]|nr:undecaprenyldiphospho-muramoylpentapeptide beta-N-acetylglucosaminyltransferase [Deltaproteobacteria bacterium]